ncbi:penicillin-binding protein activator [Parashewanella curva]|uniref:Penicillin-binding protein activator n=1 Tax=Parashewanella curva TaxID=2338552 RepID=A0A3L8PY53_9GAMM|nr:penicillin-binding protein activator [Parashewanella curva]RLV59388.1 penicillin-binding protein activator [Parashewanella curva]
MLKNQNIRGYLVGLLASLILLGCSSSPNKTLTATDLALNEVKFSATEYLAQAKQLKANNLKLRAQLLAAHAFLDKNQSEQAITLLAQISSQLTTNSEIQAEYRYLQSLIAYQKQQYQQALDILSYPDAWQLPRWQWRNYYQQRALLFGLVQQPIKKLQSYTSLAMYVDANEASKLNQHIWQTLSQLKQEQLASLKQQPLPKIFSGWIQLAYIAKFYGADPMQLISNLSRWQHAHSQHPAAVKLPDDLQKAINTKPYQPQKIAVLLPLTGNGSSFAEPIKAGIVNRYYKDSIQTSIQFYDTSPNVEQAYQQALTDGAEFIIGPLLPNNVVNLHQLQKSEGVRAPQLFLNQLMKPSEVENTYFFSLSPQQEAVDGALRMQRSGVKTPLVFATDNSTGRNMALAFKNEWFKLTGAEAETHFYADANKMKQTVQQAMGVSDSLSRIAQIKSLLRNKVKADFRSRRDIDAIYMLSGSRDLPLLKPFIDVSFSVFARPVPLYTSSRSRPNLGNSKKNQEYNGIIMSEAPWLMQNTAEHRTINQLWPTWSYNQQRLYTMGNDALALIGQLAQMRAFPGFQFRGESGTLSVEKNGVIRRQLQWGQYKQGVLYPL